MVSRDSSGSPVWAISSVCEASFADPVEAAGVGVDASARRADLSRTSGR
jgi:hypothetical protein